MRERLKETLDLGKLLIVPGSTVKRVNEIYEKDHPWRKDNIVLAYGFEAVKAVIYLGLAAGAYATWIQ